MTHEPSDTVLVSLSGATIEKLDKYRLSSAQPMSRCEAIRTIINEVLVYYAEPENHVLAGDIEGVRRILRRCATAKGRQ